MPPRRHRGPVKRHQAEQYVLVSLISFGFTVLTMRAILRLSGYPQIGDHSIHIAHMLFGGLGLFAASLLLIVVSNRWALFVGAVLSGGGVGLFIDEVGKYVTRNNNYFTPAAAPIIYGLFIATVLLYLHVRRPPRREARGEMHRALEQMAAVLDHRAGEEELDTLTERLLAVEQAEESEAMAALAQAMGDFVAGEKERVAGNLSRRRQARGRWTHRLRQGIVTYGGRHILAVLLLTGCATYEILDATLPLLTAGAPGAFSAGFLARAALEGSAGVAALTGAGLIALRCYRTGLSLAVAGLVFGLTVSNLLVLYEDQVRGLLLTTLQCAALTGVLAFRCTRAEQPAEAEALPSIPVPSARQG